MQMIDAKKAAKEASRRALSYEPCVSEYEEGVADTWENAADFIANFKSVDAEPVIHAHWIDGAYNRCSNCNREMYPSWDYTKTPYCPYCGAIMDEVVEQ